MKKALFWMAVGGVSFWVPGFIYIVAFPDSYSLLLLNCIYLADLAGLIAVLWFVGRTLPQWGWALLGIYVLGPFAQMAPAIFMIHPHVANPASYAFVTVILCFLPPVTLWLALLNGTIVAVLIATVTLACLTLARQLK